MKRLLAMLLALSMVISLLPATVLAEEEIGEETFLEEQLEEPEEETEEETEPSEEPTEETTVPTEEEPTEPSEEETAEPAAEELPEVPEEEGIVSEEAALDAGETSGTTGDLTWTFANGTLTISGTGAMADYKYDYDQEKPITPWVDLDVKTLVLSEGATSVGEYAFCNMSSLTGVLQLPSSLETIGEAAFAETGLTSVTLNEGLKTIGSNAFVSARELTLQGGFPESLQRIESAAFMDCYSLTGDLTFGSKLESVDFYAFAYTGITKVTLPDRLSAAKYSSKAFMGCESLTAIEVSETHPDFKTVDGVLYSQDGTTLLSGPSGKTGKLTVPEGVTIIKANAFYLGHITEVSLPTTIKSIEEKAFNGSQVQTIVYAGSKEEKDKITIGEDAFPEDAAWYCTESGTCGDNLTWTFANGILTISGTGAMADYEYNSATGKTTAPWAELDVKTLVLSEGVTSIGNIAFYGMTSLTGELKLPESLETIGGSAFYSTGLTSIVLNPGLKAIESSAFMGCDSLTGGLAFGSKLESMGAYAFAYTGITKVTLPDQLLSTGYDSTAFMGCESLTAIEVSETHPDFKTEDGVLYSHDGKTLLSGPSGKTGALTVPEGVTTIKEYAFYYGHITEVSLPTTITTVEKEAFYGSKVQRVLYAGNKENLTLGENAFPENALWKDPNSRDCGEDLTWSFDEATGTLTISGTGDMYDYLQDDLSTTAPWASLPVKTLVLGESVTTIGSGAFYKMASLTGELQLPEGLRSVGDLAFAYTGITKVTVPNSLGVGGYDYSVFAGCTSLTEILVSSSHPDYRSVDGVLYDEDDRVLITVPAGKTGTLTVPSGVEIIRDGAFYYSQVTALELPRSLKQVQTNAFVESKLQTVSYEGSEEEREAIEVEEAGNDALLNADWTCLDRQIYTYDETTKTLTILADTGNWEVQWDTAICTTAPWGSLKPKTLVVAEGVATIGYSAFVGMNTLTRVELPKSLKDIRDGAFAYCTSLTELTLNDGLTTIGDSAFYRTGITELTLPDSLTDNVVAGAFVGSRVKKLLVSDNHPTLSSVDGVLYSKDGKILVAWPTGKGGTAKVQEGTEYIAEAAFAVTTLTRLELPASLKMIASDAFAGAQVLDVYYPGSWLDAAKIDGKRGLRNAQWHCAASGICGENLTWTYDEKTGTLTISGQGAMDDFADNGLDYDLDRTITPWYGFDIQKLEIGDEVTSIGSGAFDGMDTLTGTLRLPAKLEALGENAFWGTGITKLILPAGMTAKVFEGTGFIGFRNLTAYEVEPGSEVFQTVEGVLYSKDGKTLYSIPHGFTEKFRVPDGTETIGVYAGAYGYITELELPASVTTLEAQAFWGSSIKKVFYAGTQDQMEKIARNENLEDAAWYCQASGSIENVSWVYDSMTRTLTFSGQGPIPDYDQSENTAPWLDCEAENLIIGKDITAIGSFAFIGMHGLTGTLDLTDTAVTAIGNAAFGAVPVTQVKLPAELKECEFTAAFAECIYLTGIEIAPENETFASIDGVVYSKDETALYYCPAGRTGRLVLSDKTQTITSYAFAGGKVTEIVLPASLKTVEKNAFRAASLTRVNYAGTAEEKAQIQIAEGNQILLDAEWKLAGSEKIGDGLVWTLENKVLTIFGTGTMDNYSAFFPAPWNGETVTKLIVEEGVTDLGSYGFANLGIKTMTLPESLVSIGENAFVGTPKAVQITYAGSNERWTYALTKDDCGLLSPKVTAKGKNYSGDLTWSYNAKNKTLTFSGSGRMADYGQDDLPDWLAWGIPVQKLALPAGMTDIGDYAFRGLTYLQQVTLPKNLEYIGREAFAYSGLTGKLTIPDGVTIYPYAFRETAITSLVLPANVTLYENAVAGCAQLTEITYGGNADVLRAILGNSVSEDVVIHGQKPNGGTVGSVYWELDKKGTLTLSGSNNMGILPDFNSYEETPWADLTVKKLVISDGVVSIGANAFAGCATLTGELTLPDDLLHIGENAFAGTGIKTLRINLAYPKEILQLITTQMGLPFGYAETAFAGSKLTDVYYSFAETYLREFLGEDHPLLGKKLHCAYPYGGWDFRLDDGTDVQWSIDSKGTLLVYAYGSIPDYEPLEAPWSQYKVTALKLLGNVRRIGSNAFYGLTDLKKLTLPDTVTYIGGQAFYGCIGVTGSLGIPEGVEHIGSRAFGNLPKVTALTLPASLEYLGEDAFDGCTGLKTVTYAGSLAQLKELNSDLWSLGAKVTCQDNSEDQFECGAAWTLDNKGTLTIEGEGKLTLTDEERSMLDDLGVRKVVIKPGITEIGEGTFVWLEISELVLPEGLTTLGEEAFMGCENLTKVTLPASFQELGVYSLDNRYLKTIAVAKGNRYMTVKGGILYSLDMTKLLLVPASVKKLTIPDSVTTVAAGAVENANLTALTLGAGIHRNSVGGIKGFAGLAGFNDVTSLSVSKKNPSLKAIDNVVFDGTTLLLYPPMGAGSEYRVPDGTTSIAQNAFRYPMNLTRLILPDSVKTLENESIQESDLELVVLGSDTQFGDDCSIGRILCLPGSTAEQYAINKDIPYALLTQEAATLTFQADPGVTGVPEQISGSLGKKVTVPKKAPSLKGYTFQGWQVEGTNTRYQPGTTLTLAEDVTLTALFRKNGVVQEGICGPDTKWTLEKNGTLTIFGEGPAYQLQPETYGLLTAKRLVIEEGVTGLSSGLFDYVILKGQVTIPASVQLIDREAFANQTGITGVNFVSDMHSSNGLIIIERAFNGCTGLKGAVTLPAHLAGMHYTAFDGCSGITALNTATAITLAGFTSMDGVLYANGGEVLVRCPEGKTGAVTIPTKTWLIVDGAFSNSKVTTVYYQDGEKSWTQIEGRGQLPVYPTFAYEIQYDIAVDSMSSLSAKNPNPMSILPTQSISLKNATMDGYLFRGWYNADGKKVTKIAKGTSATVQLEARFDPITYTVAYNANGGKGKTDKTPGTYDQGLTIADNGFTRPGYTFVGWNTAKNGSGEWYDEKDMVGNLTTKNKATVTLYAQWEANKYTVFFDANAGEGNMEPEVFTYDQTQALTPNAFTREGYTFTGWNTRADGKGKTYKDKAKVKNLVAEDSIVLYAQWKKAK